LRITDFTHEIQLLFGHQGPCRWMSDHSNIKNKINATTSGRQAKEKEAAGTAHQSLCKRLNLAREVAMSNSAVPYNICSFMYHVRPHFSISSSR
jgi:hypothetical protein